MHLAYSGSTLTNHISLPNQQRTDKSLAVKGVPTDITDDEFKEFLDLYKVSYAKAEHIKSKKDGRVLLMFRLEINDLMTLPKPRHSFHKF